MNRSVIKHQQVAPCNAGSSTDYVRSNRCQLGGRENSTQACSMSPFSRTNDSPEPEIKYRQRAGWPRFRPGLVSHLTSQAVATCQLGVLKSNISAAQSVGRFPITYFTKHQGYCTQLCQDSHRDCSQQIGLSSSSHEYKQRHVNCLPRPLLPPKQHVFKS
jgi:hypothetical protein